jgi:8-oxo-dGTP diphosphatase
MQKTDSLEAYSVSVLRYKDQFLMLQRSPDKQFAPRRWTGLGGHIEMDEYCRLRASALREVQEESGILPQDIQNFVLRRVVLVSRPFQPFRVILYFTGVLDRFVTPNCPEGTLSWKYQVEFDSLDIIETTRPVLDLLIDDMDTDSVGIQRPKTGLAVFNGDGLFEKDIWDG